MRRDTLIRALPLEHHLGAGLLPGRHACLRGVGVFRMVTAEPHPLLKRTGLELYSTVDAGGRMQRDSVFKSVSWTLSLGCPTLAIPKPALR